MSTWFCLFKGAMKVTAKGAAITLSSTVASCTLACYIEIGAHRMLYAYFPYKYANVEHANGLTQDQLDAVRIYKRVIREEPAGVEDSTALNNNGELSRNPAQEALLFAEIIAQQDGFWTEEKQEEVKLELFGSNDLLACAMTC